MIFIVGPHSAGKTTIARNLCNQGFLHVETGDIVRKKHQEVAPTIEFGAWASEQNHQFNHYIAEAVIREQKQILKSGKKLLDVIITGNRQTDGIDYLLRNVPSLNETPNLIVYVDASEQILFDRYIRRPEKASSEITFEAFKQEVLGFDIKMGLEEIKSRADLVVRNEDEISSCVGDVAHFLELNGYQLRQKNVEGMLKHREIE